MKFFLLFAILIFSAFSSAQANVMLCEVDENFIGPSIIAWDTESKAAQVVTMGSATYDGMLVSSRNFEDGNYKFNLLFSNLDLGFVDELEYLVSTRDNGRYSLIGVGYIYVDGTKLLNMSQGSYEASCSRQPEREISLDLDSQYGANTDAHPSAPHEFTNLKGRTAPISSGKIFRLDILLASSLASVMLLWAVTAWVMRSISKRQLSWPLGVCSFIATWLASALVNWLSGDAPLFFLLTPLVVSILTLFPILRSDRKRQND